MYATGSSSSISTSVSASISTSTSTAIPTPAVEIHPPVHSNSTTQNAVAIVKSRTPEVSTTVSNKSTSYIASAKQAVIVAARWSLVKPITAVMSGVWCGLKAAYSEYHGVPSTPIATLAMKDLSPEGIKKETEHLVNQIEMRITKDCMSPDISTEVCKEAEKVVDACDAGHESLKGLRTRIIPGLYEMAVRKRGRPEDFHQDDSDEEEAIQDPAKFARLVNQAGDQPTTSNGTQESAPASRVNNKGKQSATRPNTRKATNHRNH